MTVSKKGRGNHGRATPLAVAALLCVAASATIVQTKDSPPASTRATAPQAHLTVQTNLVLVPVFVYDPARMGSSSQGGVAVRSRHGGYFLQAAPHTTLFAKGL